MNSDRFRIELLPVVTLVIWSACLVVGLVGRFILVSSPVEPVPQKPTEATLVNVSLTDSPAAPAVDAAPVLPDAPPLPQAAAVSPAVVFAIPVAVPMRAPQPIAPAPIVSHTPPSFKQITFGTGEGNQPKPEYPIESQLDGQEGTVEVQFVVGQNGRVTSTEVTRPCPWPLLNQAAERSIRETWTYPAGPTRYLKVSISYRQKH